MKIRAGFVSNSSSTSYVIALTRDFVATPEQLEKFVGRHNKWYDESDLITIETAEKRIQAILDNMCLNETIWFEYFGSDGVLELIDVLGQDVIITSIESASGDGKCVNILADKHKDNMIKKLKKIVETQDEDS